METIGQFLKAVLGDQVADAPFLKALEQKKSFIAKTSGSNIDLVRKEILKTFARSGRAPSVENIAEKLGLLPGVTQDVLKELAQFDLVVIGPDGEPISAYPFSDAPTAHKVTFKDGSSTFALCAIDALGTGPMMNQPVDVSSSCHHCGQDLMISVNASGEVVHAPPGVLVWLSTRQGCDCVAKTNCPLINFFCKDKCLRAWFLDNPNEPGYILDLEQAATSGKIFFGDFLN